MEDKKGTRLTWDDYGISKSRFKELREICRSGKEDNILITAAELANPAIKDYIVKSVRKNKSYDDIEWDNQLGRIPCGRTDFYGYRRKFYYILDQKIKEVEAKNE